MATANDEKSIEELKTWIDLYKFYLDLALKSNIFFYGVAGTVASLIYSDTTNLGSSNVDYVLFIPAILGIMISVLSFYGFLLSLPMRKRVVQLCSVLNYPEDFDVSVLRNFLLASGILTTFVSLGLIFVPFLW